MTDYNLSCFLNDVDCILDTVYIESRYRLQQKIII